MFFIFFHEAASTRFTDTTNQHGLPTSYSVVTEEINKQMPTSLPLSNIVLMAEL